MKKVWSSMEGYLVPPTKKLKQQVEKIYQLWAESRALEGYCPHAREAKVKEYSHPNYEIGCVSEHYGVVEIILFRKEKEKMTDREFYKGVQNLAGVVNKINYCDNFDNDCEGCPFNVEGNPFTCLVDEIQKEAQERTPNRIIDLSLKLEISNSADIEEFRKLEHHIDRLVDIDNWDEIVSIFDVKVKEEYK